MIYPLIEMDQETYEALLSGSTALLIVLVIGLVILRIFRFVHERRGGGDDW